MILYKLIRRRLEAHTSSGEIRQDAIEVIDQTLMRQELTIAICHRGQELDARMLVRVERPG